MSGQDNLDYSGPNKQWDPPFGGTSSNDTTPDRVMDGYHDLTGLKELLKTLLDSVNGLISDCETKLGGFSLIVPVGGTLETAHNAEWPSSLGQPKSYVSYQEYKALDSKNTRGANYIRSAYEDSARGESGTNAIDVIALAQNIKNEATNIQEFINDYIGQVDDSSEKRTLELLQDWTENAIFHTGNLRSVLKEGESPSQIPTTELDTITPERATQYQAFFKVKINTLNNQISQMQTEAHKENQTLSNVYFKKFLGPALSFRLNSTRGLESDVGLTGVLGQEATLARNTINTNFSVTLSDQIRRNTAFEQSQNNIQALISQRDKYVGYINQLSSKGASTPSQFVNVDVPEDDRQEFVAQASTVASTDNRFTSSHADLAGVTDPAAHPQYFLKAGDTITGDIGVSDGVKIDGVDLNKHAHTGSDGSQKIKGSDIVGGSINNDNINGDDKPPAPTNLKLDSLATKTIPPGVTKVDAIVEWDGPAGSTYEFQISRLV